MQTRSKAKQMKHGRVSMDQRWTELPAELQDHVLLFFPVPHICRFRTVCKRWNSLICSPEFGKLCALMASQRANDGEFLVVKVRLRPGRSVVVHRADDELPGWSILDLNEKRWYNPKPDIPKGYDDCSAMDGGLVCAFVDSFTEEQRRAPNRVYNPKTHKCQTLVMFNLFGGASKVLPNPPLGYVHLWTLNLKLIVENKSDTFKIFLINRYFCWNKFPCVSIYESSSGQWRNAPNPPVTGWSIPARSAIFQGCLYVLCAFSSNAAMLWSFNFLDNSWGDTNVQFLGDSICHLDVSGMSLVPGVYDLVVSDNRLFLMTLLYVLDGHISGGSGWTLEISEIFLADNECRTVTHMTESELARNFSSHEVRAFGFNKSIVLMSQECGNLMLYHLTTGQWEFLPRNPLKYPTWWRLGSRQMHGTVMNHLRLLETPW